jgi:hypothetical protein
MTAKSQQMFQRAFIGKMNVIDNEENFRRFGRCQCLARRDSETNDEEYNGTARRPILR